MYEIMLFSQVLIMFAISLLQVHYNVSSKETNHGMMICLFRNVKSMVDFFLLREPGKT